MTSGPAELARVGVVGLGTMGAGIAEVFARNGYQVVGVEVTDESLDRGRQHVQHSTDRAVKRGKLSTEDQQGLVDRITFTTDVADLKECDLVVEAVVEKLAVKQEIFRALDEVVGADAILATNTSSLSVTEISAATSHPGRVIGVHFFNPAPIQHLVEIVRTVVTEPDVLERVTAIARSLDKTPVVCGDKAGFIANALLFGYLNHAVSMFENRYASREDIDTAMRLGCRYPMGPLALLDLIGLDTAYEILDTMYKQGRDRLHAPAPILKQMMTAGLLGRKTGRGLYTYEAPDSPIVVPDALTPGEDANPRLRRDVSSVGVVGTGTMATGIIEVFAKAGFPVTYVGRSQARVDAVRAAIENSLEKAIQRGKLEEGARDEVLARLHGTTALDQLAGADLVVEAITEELKA
ncbi:MAG: 3-hydroxybutyryl-CoA dehydrogenase, partial [Nocardioidaceae bacterium]